MNYALNPGPVLVQSVLGVGITDSGECTHLDLMLDVFSKVTQQQISDRARMELQFSVSFCDGFTSGYYFLASETHTEQIITLSMDTKSGLKMPKTRSPHWKATFVRLTSPSCTHNSH